MSSELARIALLSARLAGDSGAVRVGIGDDAAVLAPPDPGAALVWTVDAQVEGTHFRREWASWEDVGWRSFMAAASDLAAMGATPLAALSSLVLPGDLDDEALSELATGQANAARALGTTVAGGNLARGSELSVTTTLFGVAARPLLRRGARAGDLLLLGGAVGLAAAGLALLRAGASFDATSAATCVAAWRRPRARIDLGLGLASAATAAIDVSDGLLRDAGHLAAASGVSLVFEEAALAQGDGARALAEVAHGLGRDPLDFALAGGEDYALVATSPTPIAGFVRIGRVEAGPTALSIERPDGRVEAATPRGFDHFMKPEA
jgi:thiamine-monophosphate kinase